VKYLLDTHIFLWWILGDTRLTKAVVKTVESAQGNVFVSVASLWELMIKTQTGKLTLPNIPPDKFLLREIQANRMEILTIHALHVFAAAGLPPHHKDPFDRMLIGQARAESMTLVTKDAAFQAYDVPILW
jgi:PIN domain nuclease of toxin-antitoxin system